MLLNRRTFAFAGAATATACINWPFPSRAATQPFTCKAFVDRASISLDDQFELTALIEWALGDGHIFVPLSWGLRGFRVSVADSKGITTEPPIDNFHPPPPGAFRSPSSFLHMSAGDVVGAKIAPRARDFFAGRGAFTIFVGYTSPVPRDFTDMARAVLTEDGMFNAPVIRVSVT